MGNAKRHLTYANVMATIAVVVAVAGGTTAIAVSKSAKSPDVNKKGNIRAGRVTTPKLADGAVSATKLGAIDVVSAISIGGATATCPAGERLLSGGAQPEGGSGVALAESLPDGNGWTAAINTGVGARNITVYALCLR